MSNPTNHAAYLDSMGSPFSVREAPYTPPPPGTIAVRNYAIAINPCDYAMQYEGRLIDSWPALFGCDSAGVVHEVGEGVSNFNPGDRVMISVLGGLNGQSMAAFQNYTICEADIASKIPDATTYEQACVLALAVRTAATALFLPEKLGLDYPRLDTEPGSKDEYLLVWGGSSSVGSAAIQLATSAGYKVITTASAHNLKFCTDLGVVKAFDHRKETTVDEIINFLKGKKLAAIMDSIVLNGVLDKTIEISKRTEGSRKVASIIPNSDKEDGTVKVVGVLAGLTGTETAKRIFGEFVPKALEVGALKCKPDPEVVGNGLEAIDGACARLMAGVSAQKIVVSL